ncbi:phosphoribosylformylglycinamidine synthase subunit PurL [candidate division WOR-3 bacterium]|nr:phosphoribosylformylglycinamidine synthase subunit PurL [candidate division WOR-3 bacterium]
MWRVEVEKIDNVEGESIKKDILDLGIKVDKVEVINVYLLFGEISQKEVQKIAEELLTDKVWETYKINQKSKIKNQKLHIVEIAYNPGVMDPTEASAIKGIRDLGIKEVTSVKTAKKYLITDSISDRELELVANKLLFNPTVQHIVKPDARLPASPASPMSQGGPKLQRGEPSVGQEEVLPKTPAGYFNLVYIDLLDVGDKELLAISKNNQLGLNLTELKRIQQYFKNLNRNPTDIELETIAQTWSEHCVHKTFKSRIKFGGKFIEPLFSTIKKVTSELNLPFCVSVFKDNAGIVKFTNGYNICFKVETHNHPSALEPYGGAGTGIGGVIRDTLGAGLGAKPILNTDVFCFGPPDYQAKKLPKGTLHPKRVMKGVVAGVRDYGNKLGIPTANGAVLFDERYVGNPVVYCGNVGLIPKDKCGEEIVPGDLVVLIGGRTGRDGIHGVTFASGELTAKSEAISSGAVQIGNPIMEKKVIDVLIQARDKGLYRAITDCGGGGLSSAVGELASSCGAIVDLEKVPLKYKGLSYCEIWISEAQERMIIFVPPRKLNQLLKLCSSEDLPATVIGKLTNDKKLRLKYHDKKVGELDMEFLHQGVPLKTKIASWKKPHFKEPDFPEPSDLTPYLLKILSSLNVCSKEWVIRQYDHEVQGGSVIKPLVGANGPGDACVARPLLDSNYGIVVGCGINPRYGEIDPYWMAGSAIDEALRNVVAVGADPKRVAILDNFSWGNPDNEERLGELVRAVQGCYMAAKAYGTPFISGKDSLNNEYRVGNKTISIPPTLLISAIGIIEDVNKSISSDLKSPGDLIYIIGKTYNELGGSHYYYVQGYKGNDVPEIRTKNSLIFKSLHKAIKAGLIRACHDCSEGGIGVACAEMCFAGEIGMQISLSNVPQAARQLTGEPRLRRGEKIKRNDKLLFSESNTRFIVEVSRENQAKFEKLMSGDFAKLGVTDESDELKIFGLNGNFILKAKIRELKEAWQKPLKLI